MIPTLSLLLCHGPHINMFGTLLDIAMLTACLCVLLDLLIVYRDVGLGDDLSVWRQNEARLQMAKHVRGEPVKHATCLMSESGKGQVAAANLKRAQLGSSGRSNAKINDYKDDEF